MNTGSFGGITRSGSGTLVSPYVYAVKPNFGNKPVGYVSWYDAARYVNWLNNGQSAAADTETGAYTLLGATEVPSNASTITRNPGAQVFLANTNEWHKAAYYEPGASGDSYWTYATRSDIAPQIATATATGDIANPGPNVANYNYGASWNGFRGGPTTVGSAGPLSESFWGIADMTGNQFEWTELGSGSNRFLRGGSWGDGEVFQHAPSMANLYAATQNDPAIGFRIASVIPEPCATATVAAALLTLPLRSMRRRHRRTADSTPLADSSDGCSCLRARMFTPSSAFDT